MILLLFLISMAVIHYIVTSAPEVNTLKTTPPTTDTVTPAPVVATAAVEPASVSLLNLSQTIQQHAAPTPVAEKSTVNHSAQ
jgi:hypothetical protein